MSGSESTKKKGLEHLKDLVQKLYEIEAKQFQSVSDVLNELTKELGSDDVKAVTIDSTNGKLTVMEETQKIFKISRIEMELTLQSSESQSEEKKDSSQGMYRVGKISYMKRAEPLCSIIPIILLVFLLILLLIVGCLGN